MKISFLWFEITPENAGIRSIGKSKMFKKSNSNFSALVLDRDLGVSREHQSDDKDEYEDDEEKEKVREDKNDKEEAEEDNKEEDVK